MAAPKQRGFVVYPIILTHWRFKAAGLAGTGLWVLAASWCVEHDTDGHIPIPAVKALMPGAARTMPAVAKSGLWLECTVHQDCAELRAFLVDEQGRVRQESKQERETRRERERQRKASERSVSGARPADVRRTGRGQRPDTVPLDTASSLEVPPLNPPQGGEQRRPDPRGTRIPEPFMLTAAMRQWAAENVPDLEVEDATRRFVDYWRGVPGVRGRKLDWQATWRNSLRDDPRRRRPAGGAPVAKAAPKRAELKPFEYKGGIPS